MLRGFHSRRSGIAEEDAASEGKSIVHPGFGTACPFYPLRFSQSFDFQKLMVFTTLRNEMWLTATRSLNSCRFNPLTISPQTRVFPVGFCLSTCVCSHTPETSLCSHSVGTSWREDLGRGPLRAHWWRGSWLWVQHGREMPNSCCNPLSFIWLLYTSTHFQNKFVFEMLLPLFDVAEIHSWVESRWRKGRIRHKQHQSHTHHAFGSHFWCRTLSLLVDKIFENMGLISTLRAHLQCFLFPNSSIWSSEVVEGIWSFSRRWCYTAEIQPVCCRGSLQMVCVQKAPACVPAATLFAEPAAACCLYSQRPEWASPPPKVGICNRLKYLSPSSACFSLYREFGVSIAAANICTIETWLGERNLTLKCGQQLPFHFTS